MVNQSRKEYIEVMLRRHAGAGRRYKKRLLDEVCEVCGYHRKYAIERLNRKAGRKRRRPGPRRIYGDAVREVLQDLWLLMSRPCSKLLKANLPLWLPHYERENPGKNHDAQHWYFRLRDGLFLVFFIRQPSFRKAENEGVSGCRSRGIVRKGWQERRCSGDWANRHCRCSGRWGTATANTGWFPACFARNRTRWMTERNDTLII